jgi:acyl transferase domain-containing protein
MLLENALELAPLFSSQKVGVYVGCMYTEYLDGVLGRSTVADDNANSIVGHGLSFMVGRLSFTYGLQGPCISTDTACSSSLVASHLGHTGIGNGESEQALAGGVNLMLIPQTTARICLLQALSPVGRCKTFDASADGYGEYYHFISATNTASADRVGMSVQVGVKPFALHCCPPWKRPLLRPRLCLPAAQ